MSINRSLRLDNKRNQRFVKDDPQRYLRRNLLRAGYSKGFVDRVCARVERSYKKKG